MFTHLTADLRMENIVKRHDLYCGALVMLIISTRGGRLAVVTVGQLGTEADEQINTGYPTSSH